MTPVTRLTSSQLRILLSAFRANGPLLPYRWWPDHRDYVVLAKRGLLRPGISRGFDCDRWDEFRITPAGKARIRAALGGAR